MDDVRHGERRAERLYEQAEEILAGALEDKDHRTALQAIRAAIDVMREARSYMEFRARKAVGMLIGLPVGTCP